MNHDPYGVSAPKSKKLNNLNGNTIRNPPPLSPKNNPRSFRQTIEVTSALSIATNFVGTSETPSRFPKKPP